VETPKRNFRTALFNLENRSWGLKSGKLIALLKWVGGAYFWSIRRIRRSLILLWRNFTAS